MNEECVPYEIRVNTTVDTRAPSLLETYSPGWSGDFDRLFRQEDVEAFFQQPPILWKDLICIYESHQSYLNQTHAYAELHPRSAEQTKLETFQWGSNAPRFQLYRLDSTTRFLAPGVWKHFNLDIVCPRSSGSAYIDAFRMAHAVLCTSSSEIENRRSIFMRAATLRDYADYRNTCVIMHYRADRHSELNLSDRRIKNRKPVTEKGESFHYELEFWDDMRHNARPMAASWSSAIGKKSYTPFLDELPKQ